MHHLHVKVAVQDAQCGVCVTGHQGELAEHTRALDGECTVAGSVLPPTSGDVVSLPASLSLSVLQTMLNARRPRHF